MPSLQLLNENDYYYEIGRQDISSHFGATPVSRMGSGQRTEHARGISAADAGRRNQTNT